MLGIAKMVRADSTRPDADLIERPAQISVYRRCTLRFRAAYKILPDRPSDGQLANPCNCGSSSPSTAAFIVLSE